MNLKAAIGYIYINVNRILNYFGKEYIKSQMKHIGKNVCIGNGFTLSTYISIG